MLAQTPRLIFHNKQLQLTKFGRHLRYPIKWRQWRGLESRLLLMTNVNFYNVTNVFISFISPLPHLCCQLGQCHIPVTTPIFGWSSKRFSYRYAGSVYTIFKSQYFSIPFDQERIKHTQRFRSSNWGISWVNYSQLNLCFWPGFVVPLFRPVLLDLLAFFSYKMNSRNFSVEMAIRFARRDGNWN